MPARVAVGVLALELLAAAAAKKACFRVEESDDRGWDAERPVDGGDAGGSGGRRWLAGSEVTFTDDMGEAVAGRMSEAALP